MAAPSMTDQATNRMNKTPCSECGSTKFELDAQTYQQTCADCGNVIEQQMLLTHTTAKGGSGDLQKVGSTHNMRSNKIDDSPLMALLNQNQYKLESKFRKRCEIIVEQLREENERFREAIDKAVSMYVLISTIFSARIKYL